MSKKDRKRIKVTYSTLSSPDPLLHQYFEEDVAEAKANFGQTHPMYINGEWVMADETFTKISPVNKEWTVGTFQEADKGDVDTAVAAAKAAFPGWRDTPGKSALTCSTKLPTPLATVCLRWRPFSA